MAALSLEGHNVATIQNIIDDARVILQDAAKTRYTDAQLTSICNYALYTANRLRPDLFFSSIGTAQTALAVGNTFPLPPQYEPVVSNYVASRAELRDDEYSVDGRAAALLAEFKNALLGVS